MKLDDGFPQHPKVVAAGHKAAWLYICGLAYSSAQLTNGVIPRAIVGRLTDIPSERRLSLKLVDVGLWEHHPDGFWIHDYDKHQRTKAQVERQKAQAAERMRAWRAAQEASANGDK